MNKRVFVQLAAVINEAPVSKPVKAVLARSIGAVCASENSQFDWIRWNSACIGALTTKKGRSNGQRASKRSRARGNERVVDKGSNEEDNV